MKNRFYLLMILLVISCGHELIKTDAVNLDQFIGDWQGEGHFYNVNLGNELGPIRITLRITPDLEIMGTVGDAELEDAEIEVDDYNDGIMIKGTVSGNIFPNDDFQKTHITFLLKKVEDDRSIGDFHLASNFIFDFSMRPGEMTLKRNP